MKITVRYFAGLRERIGQPSQILELPDGTRVRTALDITLGGLKKSHDTLPRVMMAVNGEYVEPDSELHDGDELALIPPVSGGDTEGRLLASNVFVRITGERVDPAPLVEKVRSNSDGCVVLFVGVTRDHHIGRRVLHLEYEAYQPMAEQEMTAIIERMKTGWDIGSVAVVHRVGRVDIGEASMVLAVSAPHRGPAFEAASFFVDELKKTVPIWKKEFFEDGEVWVGDEQQ